MAAPRKRAMKRTRRTAQSVAAEAADAPDGAESALVGVARQVRSWSDSVLGIAGAAADVSIGAAKALLVRPEQRVALEKAGNVLRGMREAAGMSVRTFQRIISITAWLSAPASYNLTRGIKSPSSNTS